MLVSNCIKKKSRKNKNPMDRSLPYQFKKLQQYTKMPAKLASSSDIVDLFYQHNLTCIVQIWQSITPEQQFTFLKSLSWTKKLQGQCIYASNSQNTSKESFILLQGILRTQLSFKNIRKSCRMLVKPGQPIMPSSTILQNEINQYSIVAGSQAILLRFPNGNLLHQHLQNKRASEGSALIKNLRKYTNSTEDSCHLQYIFEYFNSSSFCRNQTIFDKQTKENYFCYVVQGQIELVKFSKNANSPISVVSVGSEQFFNFVSIQRKQENFQMKCKSRSCRIYSIPFPLITYFCPVQIASALKKSASFSQSIHSGFFRKSQKFLITPIDKLKKRSRKKKSSQKQNSLSEEPWDLIGFFAQKMKKKMLTSTSAPRRQKIYPKSAHLTKRETTDGSLITSLQKLKKKAEEEFFSEYFLEQDYKFTNQFRPTLKNSFSNLGSRLGSYRRTINTHPTKQQRRSLIKKTKFKLMSYAKNQNNFASNDCF